MPDVSIIYHANPQDENWRQALVTQLQALGIASWDKSRLEGGVVTQEETRQALAECKIAVMLVSASFLGAANTVNDEIQQETLQLRARLQNGGLLRLIPLVVRSASLVGASAWVSELNPHPAGRKSLAAWQDEGGDKAEQLLAELAQEIFELLHGRQAQRFEYNPSVDYLRCDRDPQQVAFNRAFFRGFSQARNQPQFHLVHGRDADCPDSLVERFGRIELDLALKSLGAGQTSALTLCQPKTISFELPSTAEAVNDTGLDSLYERLIKGLFENLFKDQLNQFYMNDAGKWPEVFATLIENSQCLPSAIAVAHGITHWNAATRSLLDRYRDFWRAAQQHTSRTQFLIFLHAVYPAPLTGLKAKWFGLFGKEDNVKQFCQEFTQLSTALASAGFLAQVLGDLTEVSLTQVTDWANACGYQAHVRRLEDDITRELFRGKQHLPMNEVEPWLARFCEKLSRENL